MLVLIHGLGGAPDEMEPFRRSLRREMPTWSPTLLSHGGRPMPAVGGFDPLIEDLVAQFDTNRIGPAVLFGYSLGGYLALYLASRYPERVRGVIAIAAKVKYDGDALSFIRYLVSPERVFGGTQERRAKLERHYGGAGILEKRLARALKIFERLHDEPPLGDSDLRAIQAPVLLVSGEEDQFAPAGEMRELANLLPNARLSLFQGRAHPLEIAPLGRINSEARHFLREIIRADIRQAPAVSRAVPVAGAFSG